MADVKEQPTQDNDANKRDLQIGDAVLHFIGDTTNLDETFNSVADRLTRAIAAFKDAWNQKL